MCRTYDRSLAFSYVGLYTRPHEAPESSTFQTFASDSREESSAFRTCATASRPCAAQAGSIRCFGSRGLQRRILDLAPAQACRTQYYGPTEVRAETSALRHCKHAALATTARYESRLTSPPFTGARILRFQGQPCTEFPPCQQGVHHQLRPVAERLAYGLQLGWLDEVFEDFQ